MKTKEKIAAIITDQYNDYKGSFGKEIEKIHSFSRIFCSDEDFLAFLEKQKKNNPRPEYQLPDQFKSKL